MMLMSSSWMIAQESKVRVVVDRASIYAEASTDSYRIETVKKGMVLTLFGTGQAKENWLYVVYQSPRWNSKVTGFIQAEMVEDFSEDLKPEKEPEVKPEVKPAEKPKQKPAKLPEKKLETAAGVKQTIGQEVDKSELKPKQPIIKKEPVRIEQALGLTALPEQTAFPYPLLFLVRKSPRIYETVEPPQPKTMVTEEAVTEVLPEEAKPIVKPKEKIKTEVWKERVVIPEKTEVSEKERDIKKPDMPEIKEQPEITRSLLPREKSLFTFSLGYGPSLGGFGGFVQLNSSGNLSVHWGIGYYPTSMFYPDYDWVKGKALYSVGVKYYLPWRTDQVRPYLDLQYGGISVEAIRVVTGIWYYTYIYEDVQKTLWGPSLLAGIELRIGSFGLNGAVGASYVVTKWEYWDQPLFVTADIGFLLYF